MNPLSLIGYSGHAYVVIDVFSSQGQTVAAYCEPQPKTHNPYALHYLGAETNPQTLLLLQNYRYFIAIGSNAVREKLHAFLFSTLQAVPENALHQTAYIAPGVQLGSGIMVGAKAVVNPLCSIGNGVICNTGSVVEHECMVADFVHIAPNATLCGGVRVGRGSFVGAAAVVKEGITIGNYATIGAGAVVLKNVPDGATVVGNPQRFL